jgi:hypothetical protein
MDKRIDSLALETLEKRKADIDAEIASIQAQLGVKAPLAITSLLKQ